VKKEDMDRNVCLMLGMEEENLPIVSKITKAFLLSITHQLAVCGKVELEDLGDLQTTVDSIYFSPSDFTKLFIETYRTV